MSAPTKRPQFVLVVGRARPFAYTCQDLEVSPRDRRVIHLPFEADIYKAYGHAHGSCLWIDMGASAYQIASLNALEIRRVDIEEARASLAAPAAGEQKSDVRLSDVS